MPQPRSYDLDEFLAKATHSFWLHGYGATSLADLVAATGVNRGSIYAAYSGKRDLFLACLRDYDARYRVGFLADIAARHTPRDAILAVFEAAADTPAAGTDGQAAPPGCLLVNTAMELGPHDAEIAALVTDSLAGVEAFMADHVRAGIRNGDLSPAVPVAATATALTGFFLALRVLARSGATSRGRKALIDRARALLPKPGPQAEGG